MLKTIILRELMDYLKSNKIWICIVCVTSIAVLISVSHLFDYHEQTLNFSIEANMEIEEGTWQLVKPPQKLSVFAHGMEGTASNIAQINFMGIEIGKEDASLGGGNRYSMASMSDTVDMSFIVSVLLSLFVIFFSYDAISGEKNGGTLRAVFSNTVPRHLFLLGKMIAGFLVVALVVAFPFIIITILYMLSSSVMVKGNDLVLICFMYIISVLYLTVFYQMSLFVSVRIDNSTTGLAVLLMVWLAILHVYPTASTMVVDTMYKNPSRRAELSSKSEAYTQAVREYNANRDRSQPASIFRSAHYRGRALYRLQEKRLHDLVRERRHADRAALFSPHIIYKRAMEICSRTGIDITRHFHDQVVDYWNLSFVSVAPEDDQNFNQYLARIETPPPFEYRPFRVFTCARLILWPVFALVGMNAVLFMLAYVGFLRKDVQ